MSNKCNDVMDKFLSLDKGQILPLKVTMHLLFCKKCRSEIKMLKEAEKVCKAPIEVPCPIDDKSILLVMQKIDPSYTYTTSPISIKKWILGGICMILFMLCFGLNNPYQTNQAISIYFYLFFAILVTVYCAMFVGTNIDYFVKKINAKKVFKLN